METFVQILQGLAVGTVNLMLYYGGAVEQVTAVYRWEERQQGRWHKWSPVAIAFSMAAWLVISVPVAICAKALFGW